MVAPAFCPFQGGTLTEKEEGEGSWEEGEGREDWEEREEEEKGEEEREQQEFGAGALCIVGVAACF